MHASLVRTVYIIALVVCLLGRVTCGVASTAARTADAEDGSGEYVVGGPLAGVQLPRYRTQHGEPAGHPGAIAGPGGGEFQTQGLQPEWQLAPESVEHWRAYWFKYCPVRSFFDRQSRIAAWTAPDIPGVAGDRAETYAEPVFWVPRHRPVKDTGKRNEPLPVVRMAMGDPAIELDLGELERGLYAVRVIGAVPPEQVRPFRKPLFVRMTVNDGLDGQTHRYRRRLGYNEEFYSIGEFFFHAPEKRAYEATLRVDKGSQVDLLVRTISLDDVMAGVTWDAIKSRTTIKSADAAARAGAEGELLEEPEDRQQRLARDEAIWRHFPPVNSQGTLISQRPGSYYGKVNNVSVGTLELDHKQLAEKYGRWEPGARGMELPEGVSAGEVFLANLKLGLVYTWDDLRNGRPLPDPYPLKDDGAGLYYPDPQNPEKGAVWMPVAGRIGQIYKGYYNRVSYNLKRYRARGDVSDAHDAAIHLARFAYAYPTLDFSHFLSNLIHRRGAYGRDLAQRRRNTSANFLPHYPNYVDPIMYHYDALYEHIKNNKLLAESVGRFVPWVETPEDVIKLIDTHLVQITAKRILRYHYHTNPTDIANLAAVVGNAEFTRPWMDWLFSGAFVYPLPIAGIQNILISGYQREGTEFVGSTYYAQGEGAARVAQSLGLYLDAGGDEKYDLSDPKRYPKSIAHAHWRLDNVVAGRDFLRIGDVTGPDKGPGHSLRELGYARDAWEWTRSPRFAYIIKHRLGRGGETDAQWARIEQAAAQLDRAPWLNNRSRVMPNWAGVLEAGLEHNDYRDRRAAYLRLGFGYGHHHNDSLDLQIVAHGLPMTIDGGQRPSYSTPGDRSTRVHNLVGVDGNGIRTHTWATVLADHEGARYLDAASVAPGNAELYGRQIALIDVAPADAQEGEGRRPAAADSYVFDVFRVQGGRTHTYLFHGALHDDFQWNALHEKSPAENSDAARYLAPFARKPELRRVGEAPSTLEATWRYAREVDGVGRGEKEMLGKQYDPDSPRKYTRLHLLGVDGAAAMRAQAVCQKWGYDFTQTMVQRRAGEPGQGELGSAFVAVIEPYAGAPFIGAPRLLDVAANEDDARRAVAVQLETRTGRRDVLFAGGRPEKTRRVPEADMTAAAEFAFVSRDETGLRQATLVGGTLLEAPGVRIEAPTAQRTGRVTRVDYLNKKLWIDQAWPTSEGKTVFEAGLPAANHWTSYTALDVRPGADGEGAVLTMRRGADYYASQIEAVDPAAGTVACVLTPLCSLVDGNRSGWVASNADRTRFWRAAYVGNNTFKLTGAPVREEDFGEAGVLRLWEYGVGDTVKRKNSVSLRRGGGADPGVYRLSTTGPITIKLKAASLRVSSADGKRLQGADTATEGQWQVLTIDRAIPVEEPCLIRTGG